MDNKIRRAEFILQRNTEWIKACDNKAIAVMGLVGICISIIATSQFLNMLIDCYRSIGICGMRMLLAFIVIVNIVLFSFGLYNIASVLLARVNTNAYSQSLIKTDSLLFFGTVSSNTVYTEYYRKFISQNGEEYLNDLLSQIYITSLIASTKYRFFNDGLRFTLSSIVLLVWLVAALLTYK